MKNVIEKLCALYASDRSNDTGVRATARALKVTPMAVLHWKRHGVSAERAKTIEIATRGAITRRELRPDLFGDVRPAGRKKN